MSARADGDVDLQAVVRGELLQVALAVRDEAESQPAAAEVVEHRQGVLVQREVVVPLPLADDLDGTVAGGAGLPTHATNDALGERDPDLLVVCELGVVLEVLERAEPGVVVGRRVERETVPRPHPPIAVRAELRARPREREVDVEEHRLEHQASIGNSVPAAGRILRRTGTAAAEGGRLQVLRSRGSANERIRGCAENRGAQI